MIVTHLYCDVTPVELWLGSLETVAMLSDNLQNVLHHCVVLGCVRPRDNDTWDNADLDEVLHSLRPHYDAIITRKT